MRAAERSWRRCRAAAAAARSAASADRDGSSEQAGKLEAAQLLGERVVRLTLRVVDLGGEDVEHRLDPGIGERLLLERLTAIFRGRRAGPRRGTHGGGPFHGVDRHAAAGDLL